MLVEYGSGSSVKTRYLLDGLPNPVAYVPVDISGDHLQQTARELARDYPRVEILPVCAGFYARLRLAPFAADGVACRGLLSGVDDRQLHARRNGGVAAPHHAKVRHRGGLLIGIDLKKGRGDDRSRV